MKRILAGCSLALLGARCSGDYHLGKVLGRGQFGTTRLAEDAKARGQTFACKSIAKGKLNCKEDIEDVQREVGCCCCAGGAGGGGALALSLSRSLALSLSRSRGRIGRSFSLSLCRFKLCIT